MTEKSTPDKWLNDGYVHLLNTVNEGLCHAKWALVELQFVSRVSAQLVTARFPTDETLFINQ